MCCNGKEKGKHFNCHWLLFRNHASSAYQWLFFLFLLKKKTCFALYGMCHKASNTVRCLSLSFELKKKKRQPYFVWKMFTLRMILLLRFQTGWLPAGTDLTHPNPYLLQTVGGGMFGGTEMLMELDSELHQGADILSTTCTLTNLFLLCCPCKRKQFF